PRGWTVTWRQQGCISGLALVFRCVAVSISSLSIRISSLPSSVHTRLPNVWLLVLGSVSEYRETELGSGSSVLGRP
ncbi:uncharacterized, partial [Tachysurus ichikawai]